MQILNLINIEKSDIKYSISRFPDGEVQITLEEFSRKDDIRVECRITSAEELFILMQVADILNRHSVVWYLDIYYLMGARMDRVMNFNRPYTLKVVTNILKSLGYEDISVLEAHSDMVSFLLRSDNIYPSGEYCEYHPDDRIVFNNYLVVFPDTGAFERYDGKFLEKIYPTVMAEKVRNIETGAIESIKILNPEVFEDNTKPIIVIDDLCDGGGTFVEIAKEIRKYTDKELNIFVTHMVNPKGIENLSKNFNHVWFTNSYKDWENEMTLPENVTQINII